MNLIGLQDINILNVANIDQTKYIFIELFKVIPRCPKCNCSKSHIHDYYTQKIKDIPILGMNTFSKKERESVKYFITDMYSPYKNIIKLFPNAIHIVDKYHYIRQVIWAFENLRKSRQKKMGNDLRIYFKRSKSLLTKLYDRLTKEERIQVDTMLWYDDDIREAYHLKEQYFKKVLASKTYKEAKVNLSSWLLMAQNSGLKEYDDAIKSHINWRIGILNSFTVKYTNGATEGFNNKIKVLKRLSYGFRNFETFRKRILLLA